MVGAVLEWALAEGTVGEAREAVDYVELLDWDERRPAAVTHQEGDAVIEKLRALGYLAEDEAGPASPAPSGESARSLLNLGTVLLEQDRPEEALEAYQKALALEPESPGAWLKCGVAQHRLGRFEDSLASNRRALELGRTYAHRESASVGTAVALVELGRSQEALQLLEAATAHLPDSFILWKMRGDISLAQGDRETARRAYTRALELQESADVCNRLAALLVELDGDRAGATELWLRSLRLEPDQPRVRDALEALGEVR